MKALTVRYPWAQFIAAGAKTVENRNWRPASLPAQIAIHAGVGADPVPGDMAAPPKDRLGQAVALVTVASCHAPGTECGAACAVWGDPDSRWHWVLSDMKELPPGPKLRGQLGLWDLSLHDITVAPMVGAPHASEDDPSIG